MYMEDFMPFVALVIGVVLAVLDQVIKYFVSVYLQPIGSLSVIDGVFNLTYVENKGVAFGMFADMRWIFVIITVIMLLVIIFYMLKKRPKGKFFYICASMIIGGGIGNLIDRILYGYVIDYLSLSFFSPVCNFADYCITIGTVLLMVYILLFCDSINNSKKADLNNDRV